VLHEVLDDVLERVSVRFKGVKRATRSEGNYLKARARVVGRPLTMACLTAFSATSWLWTTCRPKQAILCISPLLELERLGKEV
jgi:hypothetical protein